MSAWPSLPAPALALLVEGPTLADRLARGPIPLDEAIAIARQIVQGLEATHEQGIVHTPLPFQHQGVGQGTFKILQLVVAPSRNMFVATCR